MARLEGKNLVAGSEGRAPVNGARGGAGRADPVFVLCIGRSGSTLLRFLLDAHQDLACPPETNLPAMAVQLATVWSLIEGAPLASERGDEPPEIPDAAISGVRRAMDEMTASYLARRGKKRYCDKSLGTAQFAELLLRIYPEAKLVCLYRHPMDVIASGIEACPWGLNGYGFDPYISATPGNIVLALARYWADNSAAILAAEEQFPASCHRVRYEDLVADPEGVASGIFEFCGLEPAPGVSARCFGPGRERFGPGDYKIWHTSQITNRSVGRGWSVPSGMIPPPVLDQLNELAGKLGYIRVDEEWGTANMPADLRAAGGSGPAPAPGIAAAQLPGATLVGDHLRARLAQLDGRFAQRWDRCSAEPFGVVVTPSVPVGPGRSVTWRMNAAAGTLTDIPGAPEETAWDVVGSDSAWRAVLTGQSNLGVALRRCELRYCETAPAGPVVADLRIGMLTDLLGLGRPQPPPDGPDAPAGDEARMPATAALGS